MRLFPHIAALAAPCAACLLAALLAGCALGPDYAKPDSGLSAADLRLALDAPASPTAEPVPNEWWRLFGDPVLDALEARAHAENLDARAALVRIEESRARLGVAAAGLLPSAGADALYSRNALSAYGPMAALGAPTDAADLWQAGLAALWDLDLWGGKRRARESAAAQARAALYGKELVHVALSAELADAYVRLRGAQSLLAIARRHEALAADSLRLVRTRLKNGVATSYEEAQAEAELAQTSALAVDFGLRCDLLRNSLARLAALPPGGLDAELAAGPAVPPLPAKIPVGLPAELAARRPDIRAAEARLHAATAEIGAAEASFYPSLTLSGALGLQSMASRDLGFWDARWFNLGPSISLPLFQGGRLTSLLELRKAEAKEAALAYRKTVLTAWHEVDEALRRLAAEQARRRELARAFAESERALRKVRRGYQEGEAAWLELLTAQRAALARQSALMEADTAAAAALVALYKAVGGGWDDARLVLEGD